jgi:uncharacterized membrane protein
MNASHFHLIVNHMPAAFAMVALFVMFVGFIGKNASIKKLSLGLMVLTALACGTAYFTGGAADIYDDSFPQHERLEKHEALGKTTWIVGLVGGLVALAGLGLAKRMQEVPTPMMMASLVLLLVTMFLAVKTGNMGGQMFHPETRADPITKFLNPD